MRYPKMPKGKIMDLVERYHEQLACWHQTPDQESQYNDDGIIRYRNTWLEYWSPLSTLRFDSGPVEALDERYLVSTDLAVSVIRAKAMEAALKGFVV